MRDRKHWDRQIERSYWLKGLRSVAGIDEAGRGPLAGPVVAAAVVFEEKSEPVEGVDDSKNVPEDRRDGLAEQIRLAAERVGVGIATHEEVDALNILRATHLAMKRAVDNLGIVPDFLLIDGNSYPGGPTPFATIVGGDAACYSIAAASIIAKVERDAMMREYDKEFPGYGFARNKGYGTKEHLEAIRMYGMTPIHRRSFRMQLTMLDEETES